MSAQRHFSVLRLILPAKAGGSELAWFGFDAGYHCTAQGEASLDRLPGHEVLEIILPAKRVAAHQLTLPAQAGKHLESLIAQALEDRVLGDKTDVLNVPGPQIGTARRVWVCSRNWLETELARLTDAGLAPAVLIPDYALLPENSDAVPYAQTVGGYLFRSLDGRLGFAGSLEIIASLTGGYPLTPVSDLYRLPCTETGRHRLTGDLARFNRKTFDPRSLQRAALLLVSCGAILLLSNVIHWRQLENREARLQHDIRQTFATTFPGTPIIDPVLQWESKVREQTASGHGDALDAVFALAARLNIPIHPRRVDAGGGFVRLTLTDTEVAQFKSQLDSAGRPEATPAESGLTRLQFSQAQQ